MGGSCPSSEKAGWITSSPRRRLNASRAPAGEGGDPVTSTPAEYAADIDGEEKKWSSLVHKLGLVE
jgi:hypothetical protein